MHVAVTMSIILKTIGSWLHYFCQKINQESVVIRSLVSPLHVLWKILQYHLLINK